MARARSIKPGFFKNEVLAECSPLARLLFAGLWTVADRDGRLEDRTKRLKADLLPYDNCDVDFLIWELHNKGFIIRYVNGGNQYIQVLKFKEHQNPHQKEGASTIPAPDETGSRPVPDRNLPGLNPSPLTLNPITHSLNPHPASVGPDQDETGADPEPAPVDPKPTEADTTETEAAVAAYNSRASYTGWPQCQRITEPRRVRLRQRLKDCGGLSAWEEAMARASTSDFLCGANTSGWKADLDFFLQQKSFTKLMEGAYDNRTPKPQPQRRGQVDSLLEISANMSQNLRSKK